MKVLSITGPNLNLLGLREPEVYGSTTLEEIHRELKSLASELAMELEVVQSNSEAILLETIHGCFDSDVSGILINPGAYGHTSIALRDALKAVGVPFVEVHISNIYNRETFRHKTYLSDIASGVVIGFGKDSYMLGLRGLKKVIDGKK